MASGVPGPPNIQPSVYTRGILAKSEEEPLGCVSASPLLAAGDCQDRHCSRGLLRQSWGSQDFSLNFRGEGREGTCPAGVTTLLLSESSQFHPIRQALRHTRNMLAPPKKIPEGGSGDGCPQGCPMVGGQETRRAFSQSSGSR